VVITGIAGIIDSDTRFSHPKPVVISILPSSRLPVT